MRTVLLLVLSLGIIACVFAQGDDLQSNRVEIRTQTNAFGVEEQIMVGNIVNAGNVAYENVQVIADILDADGEIIGEAFGFLADQCGEAILDAALQPGQSRRFLASVDIFEDGEVDSFEVFPDGQDVAPEETPARDVDDAIEQVAMGEVVRIEWEDDNTLLYGIGCDEGLFTDYDWYRLRTDVDVITPLDESPNAELITDAFLLQTGVNMLTQSGTNDPSLIHRAYLTFPTQARRVVYQNDISTLITAEVDGSFKRLVHGRLSQYSLQGYVWSPLGNFVANYFGAYGEPVQYFTASATGGLISAPLLNNTSSVTIPGITDDGRSVIIGGTFDDGTGTEITGYWLSSAITQRRELLFEVDELPGNNYPAPAYYRHDSSTRYIYFVRPIEGVPTLQCFYREGGELFTLSELPLQLDSDEKAWTFLSPDNTKLAIAASGDHAGLWIVDLEELDTCRNGQ